MSNKREGVLAQPKEMKEDGCVQLTEEANGKKEKARSMHMRVRWLPRAGENTLALLADALIGRLELRLWGRNAWDSRAPAGRRVRVKDPTEKERVNPPSKKKSQR